MNEAVSSGAKVLVIDDSNTIRRSAEIFLRQGGHEVVLAEDGLRMASERICRRLSADGMSDSRMRRCGLNRLGRCA